MFKHSLLAVVFFALTASLAAAQDETPEPYAKMSYLILNSSKSYAEAEKVAQKAAEKLGLRLDLRELGPHEDGLTWTKDKCEEDGYAYPCYIARGRIDRGDFVSVEYSDAIKGFRSGYYIVVASVSPSEMNDMGPLLKRAKKTFKDAYVKRADVYMGCMH